MVAKSKRSVENESDRYISQFDVRRNEYREQYYKIKAQNPNISIRGAALIMGVTQQSLGRWIREWDAETIPEVEALASTLAMIKEKSIEALESLDTGGVALTRENLMHILDSTEEAIFAMSNRFPANTIAVTNGGEL